MGTITEKLLRVKETKTGFKDLITEKGGVITETTTFHEYIDEARKLMESSDGVSGEAIEISTEEELDTLITAENIAKFYQYTGETTDKYIKDAIYVVQDIDNPIIENADNQGGAVFAKPGENIAVPRGDIIEKVFINTSMPSLDVDTIISSANIDFMPGISAGGCATDIIFADLEAEKMLGITDLGLQGCIQQNDEQAFEWNKYFLISDTERILYVSEACPQELLNALDGKRPDGNHIFDASQTGWNKDLEFGSEIIIAENISTMSSFAGLDIGSHNEALKDIIFIDKVDPVAFEVSGVYDLKYISLTNWTTNIYEECFKNNIAPYEVTIDSNTFSENTDFIIPETVTYIYPGQYQNLKQIKSVSIPPVQEVKTEDLETSLWGIGAFFGCNNLKSIKSPVLHHPWMFFMDIQKIQGSEEEQAEEASRLLREYNTFDTIEYTSNNGIILGGLGEFAGLSINKVILPEGLTKIPGFWTESAGFGEVNIPSTITSFGESAFSHGYPLIVRFNSDINLFNMRGYYGASASSGSNKIYVNDVEVGPDWTISEGLTALDQYNPIENYLKLENLTLPVSLETISDNYRFGSCGRKNIFVKEGNLHFSSIDGVLYNKEQTKLIRVPYDREYVVIPQSVETLSNNAFYDLADKITVYSEVESQPSEWGSSWISKTKAVYWAGQWKYVNGVPTPIS